MQPTDAAARWARVWRAAWEARDADAIVGLYATGCRHWTTPFRDPGVGPDGVRAYVERVLGEERNIRAWFGTPLVEQERAAVDWWATLIENDREITLAGVSLLRFDGEGLVIEQRDAWNEAAGRLDPPAEWAPGSR